jgi:hypothetical protein
MTSKVTNNATTTLAASITSTATTINLLGGTGALFPTLGASDWFWGTLMNSGGSIEVVKVTARSTDALSVLRGQDNTTALAWNPGDKFELRPTAALFNDKLGVVDAAATYLPQAGGTLAGGLTVGGGLTVNGGLTANGVLVSNSASANTEIDHYFATGGVNRFYFANSGTAGANFALCYCNSAGAYVGQAFSVTQGGAMYFSTRPSFNFATPWDSNNFNPASYLTTGATAAKASTLSSGGGNGTAMTFNWNGQAGTPSYVWGGSDGVNMYVYQPSNFSVNYANSAGSVGGVSSPATHGAGAGQNGTQIELSGLTSPSTTQADLGSPYVQCGNRVGGWKGPSGDCVGILYVRGTQVIQS